MKNKILMFSFVLVGCSSNQKTIKYDNKCNTAKFDYHVEQCIRVYKKENKQWCINQAEKLYCKVQ